MKHVRYVVQPEDSVWVILDTSAGVPWKAVAKYPSREEAEIKAWEMNKMQNEDAWRPKAEVTKDHRR